MIPLGILGTLSGGAAAGAYELISTTVLSSSAASVTFSGIDQTYKHLQIRATSRSANNGSSYGQISLRFNADSATNYSWHSLSGDGSTVSSGTNGPSQSSMRIGQTVGSAQVSTLFSFSVTDILDYSSVSKYKTIRTLNGKQATNPYVELYSGSWRSTNALTSITVFEESGSLATGSRFSLYGIK